MIAILGVMLSRARRHHVVVLLLAAVISILAGATLFAVTQHVAIGTGLYWAVVTAATVGYGDVVPHDTTGRVIAVGVILTAVPSLASVFALTSALSAAVQIRSLLGMERRMPKGAYSVVYGWHPAVPGIARELLGFGREVVVVANVPSGEVGDRVYLVQGDPTKDEVIRKTEPHRAVNAVVVGKDDGDVLITCVALRSMAPDLPIYALTNSAKIGQALRELGLRHTMSSDNLVAHTIAKSMEAPHVGNLLMRMINSERYRVVETPADEGTIGHRLAELAWDEPTIVLGLVRGGRVRLVLDDDPVVADEDLIVTLERREAPANRQRARVRSHG